MAQIKILPENLSNKIAAGEVVERPASVVKELVENALDAGGSRIFVDVEKGGRGLIQVADNGSGMSYDDALLSIERYATSKITKDPDLFAIQTLGFRGEALPSIASVSHFALTTRNSETDAGTRIEIAGGRIERVTEVGAPAGTLITVRRLFFNTPARRKFLKTIATEMGHIVEIVSAMALGWPHVQVRLRHNGKTVKSWLKADAADRVADVLGAGLRADLVAVEGKNEDVGVTGWIGAPRVTRSTNRGIYLFVNGRFVRDRVLQHAIFSGYTGRLVKGQYPVAVVWVRLPFDQVDVNVHPTKHEVRFARQKLVHDTVAAAVSRALTGTQRSRWYGEGGYEPETPLSKTIEPVRAAETPSLYAAPIEQEKVSPSPPIPINNNTQESVESFHYPAVNPPEEATALPDDSVQTKMVPDPQPAESKQLQEPPPTAKAVQNPLWEKRFFADLRVIGQLHDTYLICEGDDGLVLIDQHAAHERIAYEQLKRSVQTQKRTAQRLLLPETVELGFREAQILTRMLPDITQLGLEIEPFGGTTFVVTAVPDLLSRRQMGPLIEELVEQIADVGVGEGLETILDQCLMVMACHSTIRANQALSPQQTKALLEQLDRCDQPSHCPHGRPTWIQWSLKAVQKAFNRIV